MSTRLAPLLSFFFNPQTPSASSPSICPWIFPPLLVKKSLLLDIDVR